MNPLVNTEDLLQYLNQQQQAAVSCDAQNVLVLAGAGSGKTRVLVHRIAWLIQQGVSPHHILAVTFTNKAAREMRERLQHLLNMPISGMWVGTFHGLAHRLIRTHWNTLGLIENFQILDSDDQKRLIKRIMKELSINDKEYPIREVQGFINNAKENGQRAKDVEVFYPQQKVKLKIYENYESLCNRSSLIDFSELLLRAQELWLQHPEILRNYQERFQYLLIDEFQDINTIQYAWFKCLSGTIDAQFPASVTVVGDDDQSIYGWRGAKIEHIQQFASDFNEVETIRLEQNYRSSKNILDVANAIIDNNPNRLGKSLWTQDESGEPVKLFRAFNEIEEAAYVVSNIKKIIELGRKRAEIGVLYRSNAQSRLIEEQLLQTGIPYRVYGGLRFFDRAEIRDALAYLRLLYSSQDDAALERIINTPARGIGLKTIEQLRQLAREQSISLWQSIQWVLEKELFTARTRNALADFCAMFDKWRQLLEAIKEASELSKLLATIYQDSKLLAFYANENTEKSRAKLENLDELVNAINNFAQDFALESTQTSYRAMPVLREFLGHAVLESSETQSEKWEDCVQLMTMHSAKGLEFPFVFILGLEQGLFPHRMSMESVDGLAEERRLCYVGITRAMEQLHLSYAESRYMHGKSEMCAPSQFIGEIPDELLQYVRPQRKKITSQKPTTGVYKRTTHQRLDKKNNHKQPFKQGQQVQHKKFGEGTIIDTMGEGDRLRLQVEFNDAAVGKRWLLAQVAQLDH